MPNESDRRPPRSDDEQSITGTRLFISYSHADSDFVEALEPLLDAKGVRYWRDVHDLKAGRLDRQIDRAITLHPRVLLVLSERSVESDWVEHEVRVARQMERQLLAQGRPHEVLIPIALDDAWTRTKSPIRSHLRDSIILDFSKWAAHDELARLFLKLSLLLARPATTIPSVEATTPDVYLVWDPEAIPADLYADLVEALGKLVRAHGGAGIIRSRDHPVTVRSSVGVGA